MTETPSPQLINADLVTLITAEQAILRALTFCVLDPWNPDKLHHALQAQATLAPDVAQCRARVEQALR